MVPHLLRQAANRIMRRGVAIVATIVACAVLFWVMGVLLLTRQTCQLLILMSGVGIGAICMAFHARKRGSRVLLVIALAGLALAVGLGFMARVDMLEPEILFSSGMSVYAHFCSVLVLVADKCLPRMLVKFGPANARLRPVDIHTGLQVV